MTMGAKLLLYFAMGTVAFAGEIPSSEIRNLATIEAADKLADELIRDAGPVTILHVGDSIPRSLSWLVLRLDGKQIPYKIQKVSGDELKANLDASLTKAVPSELLDYNLTPARTELATEGAKSVTKRAGFFLRKLTHLPNGISLIFKLKRSGKKKAVEALNAAAVTVSAYVSIYASTRLQISAHPEMNAPWVAASIFSAWAFWSVYYNRAILQLFNQVKEVRISKENEIQVLPRQWFFYLAELTRSTISNSVLYGGTYGFVPMVRPVTLWRNLELTSTYVASRVWMDRWLSLRMPTKEQDPDLPAPAIDRTGVKKWSFIPWFITYQAFDLSMTFLKNLNVQGYGGLIPKVFWGLGALGVGVTAWNARAGLRNLFKSQKEGGPCQSLLLKSPQILVPAPLKAEASGENEAPVPVTWHYVVSALRLV